MEPQQRIMFVTTRIMAQRLMRLQDWLIEGSLPILGLAVIVWALGNTYPVIAPLCTITTNTLLILVSAIAMTRLAEYASTSASIAFAQTIKWVPLLGFLLSVSLLLGLSANIVTMVLAIGQVGSARLSLIGALIAIVYVLYALMRNQQARPMRHEEGQ